MVLAYIYEHCFFSAMQKNLIAQPSKVAEAWDQISSPDTPAENSFFDAEFLKQVASKKQQQEHIDEYVQAQVTEYLINQSPEEDAGYLMKYGFDQWQLEEIDTDYVFKVTSAISRYEEELIEKVNQNTQAFQYEQMDIMDQVCLLQGYLEVKVMDTPPAVVINEMVELAKRYSDDGAPKLVNGLLNAILIDKK
mgnify:FL=1